ncbi:thymidylate kinase [Clostridium sp. C105KSO15]|nr:thymidylate kinase [Clostridium sp. C105KSO15]
MSKLIIIEGIDGSGKTTIAQELSRTLKGRSIYLDKKSIDASTPFQRSFMSKIKQILWESSLEDPISEIDEEAWLYLHILWYHLVQENVLKPKIDQYDYIIMDGWYYKFLARHIVNKKIDVSLAKELSLRLVSGDMVFLLEVDPEVCYERKKSVKPSECGAHMDKDADCTKNSFYKYQELVHNAYLLLDVEKKLIRIKAHDTVCNLVDTIIEMVENYDT